MSLVPSADNLAWENSEWSEEIEAGEEETATSLPTYIRELSEVRLKPVNAAMLSLAAQALGNPPMAFLPLLGQDGFFVEGFSHLLSGFPKTGKTTLLVQLIQEWGQTGKRVLYLTEEPLMIWCGRIGKKPTSVWNNLYLLSVLGYKREEVLAVIGEANQEVVIIDTLRLLGIEDENDNAKINQALTPLIALCRKREKTLIILHHTSKKGGEHGRAAAGGHALVGIVDALLELDLNGSATNQRKVKVMGRMVEASELIYEKRGELLVSLGSPQARDLEAVKARLRKVLSREWQTTKELRTALGDNPPSLDQVENALKGLAEAKEIDRDPPITEKKIQGKTPQWRLNFTSDSPSL